MKEMTVGERIQQLRKAASLSQEQLAEQLDVSRQSVSKWELNDAAPEISKIIALSELFGISTDELLKGAESIPAAAGEKESIAAIARLNAAEKRIRTGFITAVAGLIMLALELLLLPVMQVMEHNAFGHFLTNAMDYAGKMPMKAVIFITAAAIAAGGIFMYQGYLCKKKQSRAVSQKKRPLSRFFELCPLFAYMPLVQHYALGAVKAAVS